MVAVFLGLCLLIILVLKKVNFIIAAPVVIILVAWGNAMNPYTMVTGPYMEGLASFIQSFLFVFLLGTVFGKVMEQSGCAYSIGQALMSVLGTKRATTAVFLASFLLCAGGISGYVIIFTMYPLGMAIFHQANLPRRLLLPCIGAGTIMAIATPGTPQIQNLILMDFFSTTSTAGFWPGLLSITIASLLTIIYLEKQAKKARVKEDCFTSPKGYTHGTAEKVPPFWLACLPLVVIVLLLSAFGIDPIISLSCGVVLGLILLKRWLPGPLDAINEGVKAAMAPLLFGSSSVGFGMALKTVPAFLTFIASLAQSSLNPLVLAAITTNFAAGMMGSASGGLVLTLATVGRELSNSANPELLHRIMALSAAGLDTLPHNNGYLTMLAFSGLTVRETYKDYFVATLVTPIVGLTVILILHAIGVPF